MTSGEGRGEVLLGIGDFVPIPVVSKKRIAELPVLSHVIAAQEVDRQFLGRVRSLEGRFNGKYGEIWEAYSQSPAMQMSWTVTQMMMLLREFSELHDLLISVVNVYADTISDMTSELDKGYVYDSGVGRVEDLDGEVEEVVEDE